MLCALWSAPVWAQEPAGPEQAAPEALPAPDVPLNKDERRLFRGHEQTPMERAVQLRAGAQFMGLFKSKQGQPGTYASFGLRYRGDKLYLDMHLPALFGAMDYGQLLLQRDLIGRQGAFDIFRAINSPPQYSFLEAGHVRVGQIFSHGAPWGFAAGVAVFADFVVFDALFADELPQGDSDFEDFLSSDPFVVGPGGFIALTRRDEGLLIDWAFEAGRDLMNFGSYAPVAGWIISTDLEVQPQLSEDWAGFLRVRTSYYSHLPGRYPFTALLALGVSVRL
jgi:hypothetical protein